MPSGIASCIEQDAQEKVLPKETMTQYTPKTRPNLKCQWLSKEEAEKKGYRPWFGYCLPSEYHMLTRKGGAEEDLIRAGADYIAVGGNSRGVMLWVK